MVFAGKKNRHSVVGALLASAVLIFIFNSSLSWADNKCSKAVQGRSSSDYRRQAQVNEFDIVNSLTLDELKKLKRKKIGIKQDGGKTRYEKRILLPNGEVSLGTFDDLLALHKIVKVEKIHLEAGGKMYATSNLINTKIDPEAEMIKLYFHGYGAPYSSMLSWKFVMYIMGFGASETKQGSTRKRLMDAGVFTRSIVASLELPGTPTGPDYKLFSDPKILAELVANYIKLMMTRHPGKKVSLIARSASPAFIMEMINRGDFTKEEIVTVQLMSPAQPGGNSGSVTHGVDILEAEVKKGIIDYINRPVLEWVMSIFAKIGDWTVDTFRSNIPIMFLTGGQDLQVSAGELTLYQKIAEMLPNVTFLRVPGAQHEVYMKNEGVNGPDPALVAYFKTGIFDMESLGKNVDKKLISENITESYVEESMSRASGFLKDRVTNFHKNEKKPAHIKKIVGDKFRLGKDKLQLANRRIAVFSKSIDLLGETIAVNMLKKALAMVLEKRKIERLLSSLATGKNRDSLISILKQRGFNNSTWSDEALLKDGTIVTDVFGDIAGIVKNDEVYDWPNLSLSKNLIELTETVSTVEKLIKDALTSAKVVYNHVLPAAAELVAMGKKERTIITDNKKAIEEEMRIATSVMSSELRHKAEKANRILADIFVEGHNIGRLSEFDVLIDPLVGDDYKKIQDDDPRKGKKAEEVVEIYRKRGEKMAQQLIDAVFDTQ